MITLRSHKFTLYNNVLWGVSVYPNHLISMEIVKGVIAGSARCQQGVMNWIKISYFGSDNIALNQSVKPVHIF